MKTAITPDDLEINLTTYFTYFPHGVLPIACTPGADLLCLDMRMDPAPVLYFDEKPSWGNNIWNEQDLYPVAPDFEAFLDCIHEFISPDETEQDRIFRTKDLHGLKQLLESGLDLEQQDEYGRTLMERAAITGSPGIN